MKGTAVIEAVFGEFNKIVDGIGCRFTEKIDADVTMVGVNDGLWHDDALQVRLCGN